MSLQSPCMMQLFPTGSGIAARGEVTLLTPEIKGQTSNESIAAGNNVSHHHHIITSSIIALTSETQNGPADTGTVRQS
eukprot:COSAG06_NODE_36366_length_448_cov_0.530086_1_plen_77_part_01